VSPADESWIVSREQQVLARYPDQARATVSAVALAQDDQPSELYIKDLAGRILERRAFDVPGTAEAGDIPEEDDYHERFPIVKRTEHGATMLVRGNLAHEPWLVQMTRVILEQLEDPELQKLTVDMSGVTDFDVSSVAGWVGLEHFVRERHRTLAIVNASPAVHDVLGRMAVDH
jgi:anti-anti-sigma regulatory factor